MAWASSGGYPGVLSGGDGVLTIEQELVVKQILMLPGGALQMVDVGGGNLVFLAHGQLNSGMGLKNGVGLFGHTPPAAATVGGAATAGGTYTATEEAMLNAVYTALRSIGLIT